MYLMTFVIVMLRLTEPAEAKPYTNKCGKLPDEMKLDLLKNLSSQSPHYHWSYSMLPFFKQIATRDLPKAELPVIRHSKETFLYGEHRRKCPKRVKPGMKLCPVHYVIEHDKDRIPENIVNVKCNCKRCYENITSVINGKHMNHMLAGTCVKEKAYTLVWRRNESDCEYRKFMEEVSVSCSCKLNKFSPVEVNQ